MEERLTRTGRHAYGWARRPGVSMAGLPSWGLGSMRERVAELGGWCTVEARESGTEVVAVLPLPARVPDPVPAPVAERA